MLKITRRIGESIKIGNDVTIQVLSVDGNQVKIGTTAPKSLSVHREEVYKKFRTKLRLKILHGHRHLNRLFRSLFDYSVIRPST